MNHPSFTDFAAVDEASYLDDLTQRAARAVGDDTTPTRIWETKLHLHAEILHTLSPADEVRRLIAKCAPNQAAAEAFVVELLATDWAAYFQSEVRYTALKDHLWSDAPLTCSRCNEYFTARQKQEIDHVSFRYNHYCSEQCAQAAWEDYARNHRRCCLLCNTEYMVINTVEGHRLCEQCRTSDRLCELERIQRNNARAQEAGLPATLTLKEWLQTLDDFGWKCAYCERKAFTDLEHYIAIEHGGGTTAQNCVPACGRCNSKKRAYNFAVQLPMPESSYARVASYLASR